jgi:phenylpropionate dioxygenase-like ring-hydroxylating dioxygenase large terminal subunit
MDTLNAEVGEQLLEHIRNGTTDQADADMYVPIANFVSEERARAEIAVLKHYPLVVAHHSELPEPGAFITRTVLGTSLLLVRQADHSVKAFVNMCRHRGGAVETKASGTKRVFMCSYHGWTYDRDGGLRNVPFKETYGDVDMSCNGLISLKTEQRHGMIWVDFSGNPDRSVETFLGPEVEAQLAPFELERTVIHIDKHFDLDVNWKLVMDGAIDILHPKFLHPTGVGKLVTTHASVYREYGLHGQLFSPRKRMERLAASGEPVEEPWRYFSTNLRIYPNINFIAAPDHVEFWTVWPTPHPGRCGVDIRFMIQQDRLTPEMAERIERSWEILEDAASNEDFPMEETIQVNAQGWPSGSFLYGRNELSCQQLHRQLQADIEAGLGDAGPGEAS